MADKAILTVRPQITVPIDEARIKSGDRTDLLKVFQDVTRAIQDQYKELAQAVNLHAKYLNQNLMTMHYETSGRSFGTVYQNTTNKIMIVSITWSSTYSSGTSGVWVYVDSFTPPTTNNSVLTIDTINEVGAMVFVVPPDYYYKASVLIGSGTIDYWMEWY